jgi:hypothetical protein
MKVYFAFIAVLRNSPTSKRRKEKLRLSQQLKIIKDFQSNDIELIAT